MKGNRPKKHTMTVNQQFLIESLEESIHNILGDTFLENLQFLSSGDTETYVNLLRGAYYASMEQKTLNKLISQSIK
jgi:hypothetical protein